MKSIIALLSIIFAGVASAKKGADFGPDWSNDFSVSDLQCLKATGVEFLIIRGWQKFGALDNHTLHSL